MDNLFKYIPTLKVVVCTICKTGCPLDEVPTHIQARHQSIQPSDRVAIVQRFQHLPGIIRDQADLVTYELPPPGSPAIPELGPLFQDGLACTRCVYVTRQRQKIQSHYRTSHDWVNPRRRGRQPARVTAVEDTEPWRTGVSCQRLFASRLASQWFEVRDNQAPGQPPPATFVQEGSSIAPPLHPLIVAAKKQIQAYDSRTDNIIRTALDKDEPNLWLKRVRWAHHLEGLHLPSIIGSVSLIIQDGWSDDNPQTKETHIKWLQCIWDSLRRIFTVARESCHPSEAGLAVLFEVNRQSYDKKPSSPFDINLEDQTWAKYMNVWKRLTGFLVRTSQWEDQGTISRPTYTLTDQQEALYDKLTTRLREELGDIEVPSSQLQYTYDNTDKALLDLLLGLFDHILDTDEYESVVLSGLAAIGLRDVGGSSSLQWATPDEYLGNYSAVLKVVRLLIVHQATIEKEDREWDISTTSIDPSRTTFKPRLFQLVRDRVKRYASRVSATTQPTPFDWILESRAYGMKIQFTSTSGGEVTWRGDQVSFRNISVTMSELRDFLYNLSLELRRTMASLLLLDLEVEDFPALSLTSIADNPSDEVPGYSFASDPQNRQDDPDTWIVRRITENEHLSSRWLSSSSRATSIPFDGRLRLSQAMISSYEEQLTKAREQLLLLIYLTSGQPARTTELLNIRYRNTPYGGPRNLLISNGLLCIKTWYHKGLFRTQSYKVILRFLPQESSEYLVRLIQLVFPFWQQVQGISSSADTISPFLWAKQLAYRSDSQRQAWASYEGRPFELLWGSNHLRALLSRYSTRLVGQRLIPSTWRHIAIAISRRYLKSIFGEVELRGRLSYEGSGSSGSSEEDHPLDLQTAHTSLISDTTYGRTTTQGAGGRAGIDDEFRKASLLWHQFLALSDYQSLGDSRRKRTYEGFEAQWAEARARRLLRLQQADLLVQLRIMLEEPQAIFRGRQQEVLLAVVRGVTPVLYIDATGIGKTLIAQLPAFCSTGGVTVIIVPLIALRDDLVDRCRTRKIPATSWSSKARVTAASRILVTTAESACTKAFDELLRRLSLRDELDRVLIDECHTMLDSTAEFRPKMQEVGFRIASIGTQLIFLSATLSPYDEGPLFDLVRIPASAFTIFRGRTTRPNIEYSAREVATAADEDDAAAREALQVATTLTSNEKVLVYCRTIARGATIASKVTCPLYHSKVGSEAQKTSILESWRTAGGIIVSTNALGLGLDIPDVRLVIHAGAPFKLRDYCQESGRAGRDGQPCRAITFFHRRTSRAGYEDAGSTEVEQYLSGIRCRRAVIDEVMDGYVREGGCETRQQGHGRGSESLCDICQESQDSVVQVDDEIRADDADKEVLEEVLIIEQVRRTEAWVATFIQDAVTGQAASYEVLKSYVRGWSAGYCIGCQLSRTREDVEHELVVDCPQRWEDANKFADILRTKVFTERRLERYSGCFWCGFPQDICGQWALDGEGEGGKYIQTGGICSYKGIYEQALAWAVVVRGPELWTIVYSLGGPVHSQDEDYYRWVGRRSRWAGVETNRGVIVLGCLIRCIEDSRGV